MNEVELKLLIADLAIEARAARNQLAAAQAQIADLETHISLNKPDAEIVCPPNTATFDEHGQATP